ncbi:MAG TPA: hypothetical protein PLZ55_10010 [bacterium]|nr:hypothetical protein [bacterium]
MKKQKGIKFLCDLCGELLEEGRPRFICRGEIFCAFDGLEIEEDLERSPESVRAEMERLIREMEKRTEEDLRDEVHFPFRLDLCRKCRDRIYRALKPGGELEIKN